MPIPDFVARLRTHVGTDLLWLPGVAAVVLRRHPVDAADEVLLVQRADNQAWTVVTGILDPVEEPAVGAVREVLEETGVVARAERLVWAHTTPVIEYDNGDRSAFLSLCFRCSWLEGEPVVGDDESVDARWFRLDELPPLSVSQRRRIDLAVANQPEAVFAT
jgi:8-oxo-dGTP pyrophosphatase MutT (NUDIX family)